MGDLSGFATSTFMRGIDFYNIPTTILSQVDSSIGGKVAVNFGGVKNIVGAFYQPKAVIIDPDVLSTLPQRQIANGLAEAIKMALTSDAELFEIFERGEVFEKIETVIERSLRIKKAVVEEDEKERDCVASSISVTRLDTVLRRQVKEGFTTANVSPLECFLCARLTCVRASLAFCNPSGSRQKQMETLKLFCTLPRTIKNARAPWSTWYSLTRSALTASKKCRLRIGRITFASR